MEDLDCILAAVGGGGMISGICVAAKVISANYFVIILVLHKSIMFNYNKVVIL